MKTLIKHTLTVVALFAGAFTAQAQVKIGSNPTVIEAQSNLEVEASTPNRKVKVDKTSGQLTVQDGTEGEGKILTSDAVGGASWQPAAGSTVIVGDNNSPISISNSTINGEVITDNPITLNKGTYQLYYYVQYDYLQGMSSGIFPKYIYFDFVVTAGTASLPSYRWAATGQNDGPFVIPVVSDYQVAAKIVQLVVVTADNTVFKAKYWALPRAGRVENVGPIIAVKM
ncbi:hypothetical protein ACO2Q8_26755 [Larkinella sp. VNQ87]|uniref:hypothetical protein n=1 Tax=Larkinella sp. VNQ87 TaxID=3400921 RepID=UPI003BFAD8D1